MTAGTFPNRWAVLATHLLSSEGAAELVRLNPHLSTARRLDSVLRLAAATMLRTSRLAYVSHCTSMARALRCDLASLRVGSGRELGGEHDLAIQGSALAAALSVRRYTLRPLDAAEGGAKEGVRPEGVRPVACGDGGEGDGEAGGAAGGEGGGGGGGYVYDPRFALFEFTASVFLRQTQVRLVQECVETVRCGRSRVSQMIMGNGKTSVILPLLALLLADGRRLMMQVRDRGLLMISASFTYDGGHFAAVRAQPAARVHPLADARTILIRRLQAGARPTFLIRQVRDL